MRAGGVPLYRWCRWHRSASTGCRRRRRRAASIMDQIEGFRQYLGVAEEDRLNALNPPEKTPELFEQFLPYAIALDCRERAGPRASPACSRPRARRRGVGLVRRRPECAPATSASFADRLGDGLAADHRLGLDAARLERQRRRQRFRLGAARRAAAPRAAAVVAAAARAGDDALRLSRPHRRSGRPISAGAGADLSRRRRPASKR